MSVMRADLVAGLRAVGLGEGQVALVHSALRTFGPVDGGAETVVDAFLDVLGPRGTLVVPTFTFFHEIEDDPLIDPAADPSEMGAITEAVRCRPDARRTTAFRHSFAAIGRRAELLASVDHRLHPFDLRSSFGVMLGLDAQVVLLGVTYTNSTSHHFAEFLAEVPYRRELVRHVRLRDSDGTMVETTMGDWQPGPSTDGTYYGSRSTDFNRLGRMLEADGRVGIAPIGNAIVRRFAMRDLIARAQTEAERDYNVFRTAEGEAGNYSSLPDGVLVRSEGLFDGAGRPERHLWTVVEPERIYGWRADWQVRRGDGPWTGLQASGADGILRRP
jgi:aminoglycoside 3-N-acetyltransferase